MGDGFEGEVSGGSAGAGQVGVDAAAAAKATEVANIAQAEVLARKEQWDNKQVPDSLLDKNPKPELDKKKHLVRFKYPRHGKTSGYIDEAQLDNPDLKKELIAKKLVEYKPEDVDQKNPFFDAHFEYGGGDNYSAFLKEMNDSTNTDSLKPFTQGSGSENHGIVPKAGVSQEQIALAFDLWEARKQVKELQKQEAKIQGQADDDGVAIPDVADQSPSAEMVEAEEKAKVLEIQLAQQVNKDQEAQKLKDLQEKKVTEPEAQEMLEKLKELEKQERELRKKLANATPEEKIELELQLKRLTQDKFIEVLKALGYSTESITQLLSNESNLPVVMRLVHHTSRSKDLQSPAVREICRFARHELISSVQELLNKDPKKQKEYSWNEVRTMTGVDALRRAMSALGITDSHTQDDKIFELFNSANAPKSENGQDLHITNKDTLTVLLEALVTGEPVPDVAQNLKSWADELKKEFEELKKQGKVFENAEDWISKRIKELHPEVGEAAAIFVANFLSKHLDMGAFMEMLLTGDSSLSLARDLGYKSKEQLKAEGKEPVGVEEVDVYIRANGNHAENARRLLAVGLKDIIREENRDAFMQGSASGRLKDPIFRETLKNSVDKEHHKIFATQILTELKFGDEKTQELRKTTLTEEAFSYIMSLPLLAEKLNWQDGGGADEEKKEEGGAEKEAAKSETTSTTPPLAEQAPVEDSTPQTQPQPTAEMKT